MIIFESNRKCISRGAAADESPAAFVLMTFLKETRVETPAPTRWPRTAGPEPLVQNHWKDQQKVPCSRTAETVAFFFFFFFRNACGLKVSSPRGLVVC